MRTLEYKALKNITGAYNGSSQVKLGRIAQVEPLEDKLDDQLISWAARSIRSGDPLIRSLADQPGNLIHRAPEASHTTREEFFFLFFSNTHYSYAANTREERSYGNSEGGAVTTLTILRLIEPEYQYWMRCTHSISLESTHPSRSSNFVISLFPLSACACPCITYIHKV